MLGLEKVMVRFILIVVLICVLIFILVVVLKFWMSDVWNFYGS